MRDDVVSSGEAMPGDAMERPFVTLSYARWRELDAAERGVSELTARLAEEKARTAAVLADFEAYMREHQMLKARERAR